MSGVASSPAAEASCPSCARAMRAWESKGEYTLVCCPGCGIVSALGPVAGARLYDEYYDESTAEVPPIVARSLERVVAAAEPYRKTGRWLDVGYGAGDLLRASARAGWRCYGTEVSAPMLKRDAAAGWEVAEDLADARFPEAGFDVVTMIELIEHVPEPRRFLRQAARLVRPGGLVYLTTPNARSLNRHVLGATWSVFCPPEHLTIWTRRGLRRALEDAGLRPVRTRSEGLNPVEIVQRFRPRPAAAPIHRANAAVALNTAVSGSSVGRVAKSGANWALSALDAGDTLKIWATR